MSSILFENIQGTHEKRGAVTSEWSCSLEELEVQKYITLGVLFPVSRTLHH